MGTNYGGDKNTIETLVRAFEYFALFRAAFNLIQDGFFQGCSRMGGWWVFSGGKKSPLPKIYHIFFFFYGNSIEKKKIYHMYPTMMELGSYTLPKENPKNI